MNKFQIGIHTLNIFQSEKIVIFDQTGNFNIICTKFVNGDQFTGIAINHWNRDVFTVGIDSSRTLSWKRVVTNEDYTHRFKKDKFGRILTKIETKTLEESGETVEVTEFIENENYDPKMKYISRRDRPEWDVVGMLSVVIVRDDGTCKINGYCKCNFGIATSSEDKSDYRVIERIDKNTIKIILK